MAKPYKGKIYTQDTLPRRLKGRDWLDCEFHNCEFTDVDFSESGFKDCVFRKCKFNGVIFKNFRPLNVRMEKCEFVNIEFMNSEHILYDLYFHQCDLSANNWTKISARGLVFNTCKMEVSFYNCDLRKARFVDTDLSGSEFKACSLKGVDFSGGRNFDIDPDDCNVEQAIFAMPEAQIIMDKIGVMPPK